MSTEVHPDWSNPVEALRTVITAYVKDAQKELMEDDELVPAVLLSGPGVFITIDLREAPQEIGLDVARQMCRQRDDILVAIHISLAYVLQTKGPLLDAQQVAQHKDTRLQILVHGSHREVGFMAAHSTVTRFGEKRFAFGEIEWVDPKLLKGAVLRDVWGARHLNS